MSAETVRPSPEPRVTPGTRAYTLAVLLSHLLNPTYSFLPCLALITYMATRSWSQVLVWVGLAASVVVAPILWFIHRRVRAGIYADNQVSVREQRYVIYLLGAVCAIIYLGLAVALNAPAEVQAMLVALFAAGIAAATINRFVSKVSIHTGGMAGLATVLIIFFGRSAFPILLLVPLVAWSRVVLGRHTLPQVVAGALMAMAITTAVLHAYGY
jgi:membrane-associated phospholipid phosphatase